MDTHATPRGMCACGTLHLGASAPCMQQIARQTGSLMRLQLQGCSPVDMWLCWCTYSTQPWPAVRRQRNRNVAALGVHGLEAAGKRDGGRLANRFSAAVVVLLATPSPSPFRPAALSCDAQPRQQTNTQLCMMRHQGAAVQCRKSLAQMVHPALLQHRGPKQSVPQRPSAGCGQHDRINRLSLVCKALAAVGMTWFLNTHCPLKDRNRMPHYIQ